MNVPYDINQAGWGSSTSYGDDPDFTPRYVVIHWGGGTSQITADAEDDRLRIWQRYHINTKGWRDIAYNYAVGDSGTIYRCRGLNSGGHTSTSGDKTPEGDSYNSASIGVVWVGGANDVDGPSDAALEAMARIVNETGLTVKGHRTVKQENGSSTACPGDDWLGWIAANGWDEYGPDSDVPNVGECAPHQVAAWEKAYNRGAVNVNTHPQAVLDKGDMFVFLDRLGLLD